MHRIAVGLTPEALAKLYTDVYEYGEVIGKLKQHKVLVSDIIIKKYENFFKDQDVLSLYQRWFAESMRYGRIEYCEYNENDFNTEIVSQICKQPHKLVIYDKKPIDSKGATLNQVSLEDINNNKINEFNKYCIPLQWQIPDGTPVAEVEKWFSNMLSGEEYITIIDRYILVDGGNANLLDKYYLPLMTSAKKIRIFFSARDFDQVKAISPLKKKYGNRLELKKFNPNVCHDRYIMCKTMTIYIGAGLDFVDIRTGKTRIQTLIAVGKGQTVNCPPSV